MLSIFRLPETICFATALIALVLYPHDCNSLILTLFRLLAVNTAKTFEQTSKDTASTQQFGW
jgi:hypothetical protein